jgi:hypothetical protein
MGKVVATKSAINYAHQNGLFALFCYESEVLRDLVLEPWFIMGLAQFATPPQKRNTCKNVCLHAARRTIIVLLFCQISFSPILVTSYQPEPG